jgi:hypothetical protein
MVIPMQIKIFYCQLWLRLPKDNVVELYVPVTDEKMTLYHITSFNAKIGRDGAKYYIVQ